MKTIAYIRVSKDSQDCKSQKLAILDFAHKENIKIDEFLEIQISSRKNPNERKIDSLLNLGQGNMLIVSEMSRIGRSVGEVVTTIDRIIASGVQFIAIKENIKIKDRQDLHTKVMITMFSLFAEVERELNSLRTKEALASLKAEGIKLGRPKGSLGSSKLDGKDMEIKKLLRLKVSKTSISKILEVDRSTLKNYMDKRQINIG
ncbi:recombinase family protein [Fluviispira sanaruensis]|uniref:Resolvase n=1 Tax=Fluviispira sanaruensis TaxID=2493639 RepID=A0A4P2VP11_FLUSA|nr:recombinase family protein [Fluviispira sanaruensis]BBH54698.1 resolvase [Fluviispira sanaruensis]